MFLVCANTRRPLGPSFASLAVATPTALGATPFLFAFTRPRPWPCSRAWAWGDRLYFRVRLCAMLGGQRVVLRAVVGSPATIKVADLTRPRVDSETFVTIRDPVAPNLQRRRLGSAHVRLVRPLTEFALEAPSGAARSPATLWLVWLWRRRNVMETSWGSVDHGVQLVMASSSRERGPREAVSAIPQLHFARVPDFFPSPRLAPDLVRTV